MITIGIDPHKASVTAAALDGHDTLLAELRLPTTADTGAQLLAFAARWPVRRWAVEGATGLGHTVAQQLLATGETVLDVPAKLTARARVLGTGNARKTPVTDAADAASAATVAIHNRRLRQVTTEDPNVVLRLLTRRREDLVAERTRTLSRLHVLLRELHPGGANRQLSATHAAALLRKIRPTTLVDAHRKQTAQQLLGDLRRQDRQVAEQLPRQSARPSPPVARPSPRSMASAQSWPPRSSATPATSAASPTATTTPATPAPLPSRPPKDQPVEPPD